jgi:ATP-dependent helicase/nuclease subunit A
VGKLGLQLDHPRDGVLPYHAPDGSPWQLRLLVADRAPELLPVAMPEEAAGEEVEWLPRAEVTGQQDTHTTVTALAEFSRCPRRYFVGHYLGFAGRLARPSQESAEDRELAADEFGTQVHELLAGKPVAEPDEEALRLVEVFRRSPLGRRVAEAARVEREFDFLMALEGLVIRGQVDLWFEDRAGLAIVDYKTDAVTAAEAHRRAQDYSLQLRLYAMAVERVAGRAPDRAWLHFLRPNTLVEVNLAPSLFESPAEAVREFMEAQSELNFPLNEGPHCHRCPFYKGACPAA